MVNNGYCAQLISKKVKVRKRNTQYAVRNTTKNMTMRKAELNALLTKPLTELISQANQVRKQRVGNRLDICTIMNAKSGVCREDCKFCAQSSRHRTRVKVYALKDKREIVEAAAQAKAFGSQRFGIVTSGNRLQKTELETLAAAIGEIKQNLGIAVCASLGALLPEQLLRLKQAGLSRYHHNIETSPRFYSQIVSTHTFAERLQTIKHARDAGLEVCSGGIIGLGETWEDRMDMALILRKLKVDSVPLNILIAIPGTGLEKIVPVSAAEVIRTIALFRIILPGITLKIAAGRETLLKDFQAMGFMAGANGMLIGGYLTVAGRPVEHDQALIKEIQTLWNA